MSDPKKRKTFLEEHLPPHRGTVALKAALENLTPPDFVTSIGRVAPPVPVRAPENLLEFYLGKDIGVLVEDQLARPDHYTDRQKEIIAHLQSPQGTPPTTQELNDLMLQYARSTDAAKRTKETLRAVTAPDSSVESQIIMEDGKTLASHMAEGTGDFVFERQNAPKLSI
jgi:hypothetical protein